MEVAPDALSSWVTKTRGEVPPPLVGASLTAYRPSPGSSVSQIWLFGGRLVEGRGMRDDLYVLNGRTWSRVDRREGEQAPSPRYFHTAQVWRDNLVIHGGMGVISDPSTGGYTTELEVTNSTFLFHIPTRSWRPVAASSLTPSLQPTFRYAHVSTVVEDMLVVVGGQDKDVEYIQELEVLDLEREVWVQKESMAAIHEQRGSYRTTCCADGSGNVLCYSNYNFTDVRRVFEVLERTPSSTPSFELRGRSSEMMVAETAAAPAPQGLRFPSGGVLGEWLIWGGTYIASTCQEYLVWALNLRTLQWVSLDLGQVKTLKYGSWNRGVLDAAANEFKVFGSLNTDLLEDYQKRATNFTHFASLDLETWGIYRDPPALLSPLAARLALQTFDADLGNDFEIICEDRRRVACSRSLLEQRWPWFAAQREKFTDLARSRSFEPAAGQDVSTGGGGGSNMPAACLRNAQLHFPAEAFPVVVALVQYFYALDLVTPVQLAPPVLSSLLMLSKQYDIPDLERRVVHQMHQRLSLATADSIISVAGITGAKSLMIRAMRLKRAAEMAEKESKPSGTTSASPGGNGPTGHPDSVDRPWEDPGGDGGGSSHHMAKSQSSQGDNRPRASSASMDRQNSYARDHILPAPSPVTTPSPRRVVLDRRSSAPSPSQASSRSGLTSPSSSSFASDLDTPRASTLLRGTGSPRQRTISEGTACPALPNHLAIANRSRASSLSSSHRSVPFAPSPLSTAVAPLPDPQRPSPSSYAMDRSSASRSSQGSMVESPVPETPSDFGSSPRSRSSPGFGGKTQVRHRSNLSISSSASGDDVDVFGPGSASRSLVQHVIPEVPSHPPKDPIEQGPPAEDDLLRQAPRGLAISTSATAGLEDALAEVDLFKSNRHLSLSLNGTFPPQPPASGPHTSGSSSPTASMAYTLKSGQHRPGTSEVMALASASSRASQATNGQSLSPSLPSGRPSVAYNQVPPSLSSSSSLYSSTKSEHFEQRLERSKVYQFGRGGAGAKMATHLKAPPPTPPAARPSLQTSPSKSSTYSSGQSSGHSSGTEGRAVMYGRGGAGRAVQPKAPKTKAEKIKDRSAESQPKESTGRSFMGIRLKGGGDRQ